MIKRRLLCIDHLQFKPINRKYAAAVHPKGMTFMMNNEYFDPLKIERFSRTLKRYMRRRR